jgi:hypothetical protein
MTPVCSALSLRFAAPWSGRRSSAALARDSVFRTAEICPALPLARCGCATWLSAELPARVSAFARGLLRPDSHQHNMIAQAINEHFTDQGEDHPVSYQDIPLLP